MKRGDKRIIETPQGRREVEYLGSGLFCSAFRADIDTVILRVKQGTDYSKELLSQFGDSDNPHLPIMESLGETSSRGQWYDWYETRYYLNLTAESVNAWIHYKTLAKLLEQAADEIQKENPRTFGYYNFGIYIMARLSDLVNESDLPDTLKNAIKELSYSAANYGSGLCYEFSPRNLGVDSEGRLILRDVVFDSERIRDIRKGR